MTAGRIRTRQTGATATIARTDPPQVRSATDGVLAVATRPSESGFNPLDLLYASLSACLVLSARIAASELGVLDRFEGARATVRGEKAPDGPSRIERFLIDIAIDGDLDGAMKEAIVARAEEICTVSNTLKADTTFSIGGQSG